MKKKSSMKLMVRAVWFISMIMFLGCSSLNKEPNVEINCDILQQMFNDEFFKQNYRDLFSGEISKYEIYDTTGKFVECDRIATSGVNFVIVPKKKTLGLSKWKGEGNELYIYLLSYTLSICFISL